jgi:hypothetical protein
VIAIGGGREAAAVPCGAEDGDDGCRVEGLMGVDAEQDLLRGVARDVTRGCGLRAAGCGLRAAGCGLRGKVACLLIASEPVAVVGQGRSRL